MQIRQKLLYSFGYSIGLTLEQIQALEDFAASADLVTIRIHTLILEALDEFVPAGVVDFCLHLGHEDAPLGFQDYTTPEYLPQLSSPTPWWFNECIESYFSITEN